MAQTMLTITGRVSQPPKICHSKKDGSPFGIVAVAVNNDRFDREKEQWVSTDTTFYELVCFGSTGANAVSSLSVGDPVLAIGRFRVSSWETTTYRSQTPTITVEHLGPDLRFGTSTFRKGSTGYGQDRVDEEVDPRELHRMAGEDAGTGEGMPSGPSEGSAWAVPSFAREEDTGADAGSVEGEAEQDGPDLPADEDGVVSDADAEAFLARSA